MLLTVRRRKRTHVSRVKKEDTQTPQSALVRSDIKMCQVFFNSSSNFI